MRKVRVDNHRAAHQAKQQVAEDVFMILDAIRETGKVNMLAAGPSLRNIFGESEMTRHEAHDWVKRYMTRDGHNSVDLQLIERRRLHVRQTAQTPDTGD